MALSSRVPASRGARAREAGRATVSQPEGHVAVPRPTSAAPEGTTGAGQFRAFTSAAISPGCPDDPRRLRPNRLDDTGSAHPVAPGAMDRELLGARVAHAACRAARRVTANQRRQAPGGETVTRPTRLRPTDPERSTRPTPSAPPQRTGASVTAARAPADPEGPDPATHGRGVSGAPKAAVPSGAPRRAAVGVDCDPPRPSGTAAQSESASRSSTHRAPGDHPRQMGIGRHHAVGAERSPKRPSSTRVVGLRPDVQTSEEVRPTPAEPERSEERSADGGIESHSQRDDGKPSDAPLGATTRLSYRGAARRRARLPEVSTRRRNDPSSPHRSPVLFEVSRSAVGLAPSPRTVRDARDETEVTSVGCARFRVSIRLSVGARTEAQNTTLHEVRPVDARPSRRRPEGRRPACRTWLDSGRTRTRSWLGVACVSGSRGGCPQPSRATL